MLFEYFSSIVKKIVLLNNWNSNHKYIVFHEILVDYSRKIDKPNLVRNSAFPKSSEERHSCFHDFHGIVSYMFTLDYIILNK